MMDVKDDNVLDARGDPTDSLRLIDLKRYPIHRPDSAALKAAITHARTGLAKDGCAHLAGFIRPEALQALAHETTDFARFALHSSTEYTPYGQAPDESFPFGHPRRCGHRTSSGSVTRDIIPTDALIQQLYANRDLMSFVAACLGAERVHHFADPMRGLIINSMDKGNSLGWHFDASEFIVSLMTRRAEDGGQFEYCPDIRWPGEENYDAVGRVLAGDRGPVKALDLKAGHLQIFKGRYALHRVRQIEKGVRHTVIFGYARDPGFIGSVGSTLKVYGRVTQAHIDAKAHRHSDGLAD